MTLSKSTNITLRISPQVKKSLEVMAKADGRSLNNFLNRLFIQFLTENKQSGKDLHNTP